MKKFGRLTVVVLLMLLAVGVYSVELPTMKVQSTSQDIYVQENTIVCDPLRLEMGVNMGSALWGFGFAAFETKWTDPLTFEVIGSEKYESYDLFSIAAITLDYGVKDTYTERHHFGLGTIPTSRGENAPTWGNSGKNNIMHGNLITANANVQRITIEPKKYAPKDWNGKLWIGLIIHNAGVGQYVVARIVNAKPDSNVQMPPIFDTVKKLQSGGVLFSMEGFKYSVQSYDAAAKKMPAELASYMGIFSREEARKTAQEFESADAAAKAKMKIISSQFAIDARNADAKQTAARSLLSAWKKTGAFGKEIGCIVRQSSNLVKVGVQDLTSGKVIKAKPDAVKLSAARHEHEGFQLVLTPLEKGFRNIKLSASSLRNKSFTIPQSNVRIHAVAYTRVFEGRSAQIYQPDPFLPAGKMPALKAGQNQSYWVSVKVPDNAPAGTYKGSVTISSMRNSYEIPVVLQVRNFNIPKQISLRSSFWMFRDQINRFYNLDEVSIDDYMKWIDLALEYRLNPIDVYEGRCIQYLDIFKTDPVTKDQLVNENPDWSKWDTYIDHMVKGGANTIHLGVSHHQGTYFANAQNPVSSPQQIANVEKSIDITRKHYQEKGIYDMHYMQLRDETSEPASLNVYRAVYKDMPDVKVLLTAPSNEARECLRIPCPLTPGYNKEWRDEVVKNGGEYWWYVCVGPSDRKYANLFIDQKAVQHRAWWWQTWHYEVQGLLYWGLNYYKWYGDPILGTMKTPSVPMPDINHIDFSPIESAPGDGFSIYPGPTPDKPLPSLRLEIMRDGEEDFEYLTLLEKLVKESPNSKAVGKAKKVIQDAHNLTVNLTKYELDEAVYQKMRNDIASAIESLIVKK